VEGKVGWAGSGQRRKKRGRPAGLGWCGGGKKKKRGGLEREGPREREGVFFFLFYFKTVWKTIVKQNRTKPILV
jgi:hypothetical protein